MRILCPSLFSLLLASISILSACGEIRPSADAPGDVTALGIRSRGGACTYDRQCGGRCSSDQWGTCGVCLELRLLGERCDEPLTACSRSATCESGVCKTTKKVSGGRCTLEPKGGSFDCDDELYCALDHRANDPSVGVCVPRGRSGGACDTYPGGCAGGAPCERGICVAPGDARLGDTCDDRACASGLFCIEDGRTCQPATLQIGADCGSFIGSAACVAGATCELTGEGENAPYPMKCKAALPEPSAADTCR